LPEICGVRYRKTGYCFDPDLSSELLIDSLEFAPGDRFLDMGSGTGVVGIYAAKKGARVLAVDISKHALTQTRLNSSRNSVQMRVARSDLFSNVNGRFDVVAFNAPYTRLTKSRKEDRRTNDHTRISRLRTVSRFLTGLEKRLKKSGLGYLVLSSRSPLETFERVARQSHLEWGLCGQFSARDERIFIVKLTRAHERSGR